MVIHIYSRVFCLVKRERLKFMKKLFCLRLIAQRSSVLESQNHNDYTRRFKIVSVVLGFLLSFVLLDPALASVSSGSFSIADGATVQVEKSQTTLDAMYKSLGIDPADGGRGIKIGVIDTGVAVFSDGSGVTNKCFTDEGYPKTVQLGDTRYTNNKVIVARVFNANKSFTARAMSSHGSHVSGIIACNSGVQSYLEGSKTGLIGGIAPRAQIGSYVVFPGSNCESEECTPTLTDIASAIDAAVKDGMDILNLSLGGMSDMTDDLLSHESVIAAIEAGVLVVVAAGNDGAGWGSVSSPGIFEEVVTVGAVSGGRELQSSFMISGKKYSGPSGNVGLSSEAVSAPLVFAGSNPSELSDGCSKEDLVNVAGKVALIIRGECSFTEKINNVASNGGVGVVIISEEDNPVVSMQRLASAKVAGIPAVLVDYSKRSRLVLAANVSSVVTFEPVVLVKSPVVNKLSVFSSTGPSSEGFVKPDVLAPGENIISASTPADENDVCGKTGECFVSMSGTSMATPYVVGVAAILKQAHPKWSVKMLRSAIIHTAAPVKGIGSKNFFYVGLGLINPDLAAKTSIGFTTTSLMVLDEVSRTIGLINSSSSPTIVKVSIRSKWASISKATVTLAPNSVTEYTVNFKPELGVEQEVTPLNVTDGKSKISILLYHNN